MPVTPARLTVAVMVARTIEFVRSWLDRFIDVQAMTEHLRQGLVTKAPAARLEGEVEVDEAYVVAGHKGQPAAVAKRGGSDAVAGWPARRAGARGRRTSRPSSA